MSSEARTAEAVEEWMVAHLARPAAVRYPADWAWPGEPHPSCRKGPFRIPPEGAADAPVEDWVTVRAALPHDHHVLAGGQVCPGAEGIVAATARSVHEDRLRGALASLAQARSRLHDAQRDVDRHETEVAQARALIDLTREPGDGQALITPFPAGDDADPGARAT